MLLEVFMEQDERLFTLEIENDVLENKSIAELEIFLREKFSSYKIAWLIEDMKGENRINHKWCFPGLEKMDFINYWHTSNKEYKENTIHCCFWRTA
jgi:hypothetical protein